MLSAFKLDRSRLTRPELEDAPEDLISSVWVDLIEPEEAERERVQSELGQSPATRPELEDIEASARFSRTKTACIFTPSFLRRRQRSRGQRHRRLYYPRRPPLYAARA